MHDYRRIADLRRIDRMKIAQVLHMLRGSKLATRDASPNYVADFAANRGIELTSGMITHVSNKYYKYCTCLFCDDKHTLHSA